MPQVLGEFECSVDAKGRLRLPTPLLKQLGDGAHTREFVVNRGFEKCLMLYPYEVWEAIKKEVNQLNFFNQQHRDFMRYFYRGANPVVLDGADRLLIQKSLLEYAGLSKEVVLFAYNDRIEIWDAQQYNALITNEPADFSALAQQVMGKAPNP